MSNVDKSGRKKKKKKELPNSKKKPGTAVVKEISTIEYPAASLWKKENESDDVTIYMILERLGFLFSESGLGRSGLISRIF